MKKKFLRPNNPWIVIPIMALAGVEILKVIFDISIPYVTPLAVTFIGILTVLELISHIFNIDITKEEENKNDS